MITETNIAVAVKATMNKILSGRAFFVLIALVSVSAACRAQAPLDRPSPNELGTIVPAAAMNVARAAHTATRLRNGSVLITGGFVNGGDAINSAEIFNPATGKFSPITGMTTKRSVHTATLLPDGKVLIAGGFNGTYIDTAELYDPATSKFTPAGKMTMPRSSHNAVLLNSGKVLLFGGVGTGWSFLASAEIYDPATNKFEPTVAMNRARESHSVTLLPDGRVLTTGGHYGRRSEMKVYDDAEIYDPVKGKFEPAGTITIRRHKHDAVLLADGRVLIVGGTDERDRGGEGAYDSAEIFDPKTGRSAKVGPMKAKRYKLQGTTLMLPNGKILIAGGSDRPEIFDPATMKFSEIGGSFGKIKLFSTATLLDDESILVTGGYDADIAPAADVWIFDMKQRSASLL